MSHRAPSLGIRAQVGWLTYYTGMVLVRVHDVIVRDTLRQDLTYVSLAQYCFGRNAGYLVYFLIVFTSIGSNGAYLVFIGSVMHSLAPTLSTLGWAGVTGAVMVPVVLSRNTSFLAYTSVLGNVGVALVVVAVLVQGGLISQVAPIQDYTSFESSTFMEVGGSAGEAFLCVQGVGCARRSRVQLEPLRDDDCASVRAAFTTRVRSCPTHSSQAFGIVGFLCELGRGDTCSGLWRTAAGGV